MLLFSDMINIKDFDSSLLKIDKTLYKNIGICSIGYITIKRTDDYENIHSVNPLYLMIHKVIGHIEVKNKNWYLVFDSTDENKEVFKKMQELWNRLKNIIETIFGGKTGENYKKFMKIFHDLDDDLPLNKQLKFPTIAIVVRSVFGDGGKYYPQVYLDECLYEL